MPKSKFVSEYLKADHQRLDLLFTGLIESVKSGKPLDYQQSLFHLFKTGLLRHLHWEEKVLFPVYDELTGVRSGPTRTMRAEHAEMELMIIEIEKAISVGLITKKKKKYCTPPLIMYARVTHKNKLPLPSVRVIDDALHKIND